MEKSSKYRRSIQSLLHSRWLPWSVVGLVIVITLAYELLRPAWIGSLRLVGIVVLGGLVLIALGLVYLVITRIMDLYDQREQLQQQIQESEVKISRAYKRLEAIFQVGQKYVEATDDQEVIDLLLHLSVDLAEALGASFVPLDEHCQPMAAVIRGELPLIAMDPWLEYLASPAVRAECRTCEHQASLTTSCPLIRGPVADSTGVYCLPLRRGEREYGILNLYMPENHSITEDTRAFVGAMVDETALALEGVRLRERELLAINQMQSLRQKTDMRSSLGQILENIHHTLDVDFSTLLIVQKSGAGSKIELEYGEVPDESRPFINGVIQSVIASGNPVNLGDVKGATTGKAGIRSLISVPLLIAEQPVIGAVLVGSRRQQSFGQRQVTILQTMTGQIVFVYQSSMVVMDLEYQAMMKERKRLAREIHDGLAQTLGFLKLQAAQMRNLMGRGEYERARSALDQYYQALSEAYQDARQAIDGLRIGLGDNGVHGWLDQLIDDFQETVGLPVSVRSMESSPDLPQEVHAQLIRIFQEALSNIRKHANATQVWISYQQENQSILFEIQDDGDGFSPEDVTGTSRHGLRGMRERAELIGADFQVISRPSEGTIVRIRLPQGSPRLQEEPI